MAVPKLFHAKMEGNAWGSGKVFIGRARAAFKRLPCSDCSDLPEAGATPPTRLPTSTSRDVSDQVFRFCPARATPGEAWERC